MRRANAYMHRAIEYSEHCSCRVLAFAVNPDDDWQRFRLFSWCARCLWALQSHFICRSSVSFAFWQSWKWNMPAVCVCAREATDCNYFGRSLSGCGHTYSGECGEFAGWALSKQLYARLVRDIYLHRESRKTKRQTAENEKSKMQRAQKERKIV